MTMRRTQSGSVLLMALVILIVLSLVGISAMRGGLLQNLMAANSQQAAIALNAADAGVESMYITASDEGFVTGGMLATAFAGVPVDRTLDENGALSVDPDAQLDANRGDRAAVTSSVDLQSGCAESYPLMCTGFSADSTTVQCYAFTSTATGTIADTSTQVRQWMSAMAPKC